MTLHHFETPNGNEIISFTDSTGKECSLLTINTRLGQRLWMGMTEQINVYDRNARLVFILPETFTPNIGFWLNREQWQTLLPYIHKFIETGELT